MTGSAIGQRARYCLSIVALVAVGIALRWHAVHAVLLADDYDHYAMVSGVYPVERGQFDLFDFVGQAAGEREALLRSGRLPWWSDPQIELSALRPLASALIDFDYRVLEGNARSMHVHSLLWWVVLVTGVAAVLYSVLPARLAFLAVALYAVDDAHTLPAAWLANRSELCSIAFVVWGLWAHIAWRTRGMRGGRALSLAFCALGLLAGEHAIGPLAYFASFELIAMRDAARRSRVGALVPIAILCAAYVAVHHALGYKLEGSGFYIHPLQNPLRFLAACSWRLPVLLADLVFAYGAEWRTVWPPFGALLSHQHVLTGFWLDLAFWQRVQLALGVVAAGAIIATLAGLRRSTRPEANAIRWLLVGALGALVPICGALPMSRLTLAAAIGANAAIAFVIAAGWRTAIGARGHALRVAGGALALALFGLHVVWAGTRAQREVAFYTALSRMETDTVLHAEIDDSRIAEQDVVILGSAEWATQWALPFVLARHDRPRPRSSHLLSGVLVRPQTIVRRARDVFDLEIDGEAGDRTFAGSVYRPVERKVAVGEQRSMSLFQVQVLETQNGQPTRMRFTFAKALDDPSLLFLFPRDHRLRRVRMPALGRRLELPALVEAAPRVRAAHVLRP